MRKIIIYYVISLLFLNGLWAIPEYPLSKGADELFLTGYESLFTTSFIWGKHQNLAISPNYFDTLGLRHYTEDYTKKDGGYFLFKTDTSLSNLQPSVSTGADSDLLNFSLMLDLGLSYLFVIYLPTNRFKLYIGPELTPGGHVGYFDDVINIMVQSYAYCNIGLNLKCEYELFPTLHLGVDLYNFIIGFDYGRSGYNKDFIDDITFTNWENFNRGKYKFYIHYDLSRTEVLGLSYSHNFISITDTEYDLIDGNHSIGITYTRRLVR